MKLYKIDSASNAFVGFLKNGKLNKTVDPVASTTNIIDSLNPDE